MTASIILYQVKAFQCKINAFYLHFVILELINQVTYLLSGINFIYFCIIVLFTQKACVKCGYKSLLTRKLDIHYFQCILSLFQIATI